MQRQGHGDGLRAIGRDAEEVNSRLEFRRARVIGRSEIDRGDPFGVHAIDRERPPLALEPEAVLFDEPCSALDPLASATVESLLLSLRGPYTVVIVTHNLAQARRISDQSALFWSEGDAGTAIEWGPTAQLFAQPSHPTTRAYLSGARG